MTYRWIHKVGLAAVDEGKLLVARKRSSDIFILPGGKPEGTESDLETLAREVNEELGCRIDRPCLRGVFIDVAAGMTNAVVVVRLYGATLVGEPRPLAEIEELAWIDVRQQSTIMLAPSIENKILPFLRRRGRSGLASTKPARKAAQGILEFG